MIEFFVAITLIAQLVMSFGALITEDARLFWGSPVVYPIYMTYRLVAWLLEAPGRREQQRQQDYEEVLRLIEYERREPTQLQELQDALAVEEMLRS